MIPRVLVSEGVAVESVVIEIVQAAEILGGKLVMGDLVVRQLLSVSKSVAGDRVVVRAKRVLMS